MQCRMLPLEIASELERLTGCHEIRKQEKLKMTSLDPDCHFIADIGEMTIRRMDDQSFSERMYESINGHSDGGYESDDERDEAELIVSEYSEDQDVESDLEVQKSSIE
jgi:hypothetical protein